MPEPRITPGFGAAYGGEMARRPVRDVPLLSSDVVRSWIAIGAAFIVMLGLQLGAVLLVPGARDDIDTVVQVTLYAAWVALAVVMGALTVVGFRGADAEELRRRLRATEPSPGRLSRIWWAFNGGGAILWAITGTVITMYTLIGLALSPQRPPAIVVIAGAAVLLASAGIIIVSYAVHYARLDAARGGLVFPGEAPARFADYLYLAAQVSTTFGGADVSITTTRMRRAVAFHGVIAWAFNAVLVALFVSVLLRATLG